MPGVRLVHDTLRGTKLAVEHPTRRYKAPYLCPTCVAVHLRKMIHLDLDGEGAVIVSAETLALLRQAGLPGLTVSNEVVSPPPQVVKLDGPPGAFAVETRRYEGRARRLFVLRNRLLGPRKD